MTATVLPFVIGMVALAGLLTCVRLLRGPALIDRLAALDCAYLISVLLLMLLGLAYGQVLLVEIAIMVALLGFLSTWVLARAVNTQDRS
jgi:multicomponent K+:H+ antiporter subunit F